MKLKAVFLLVFATLVFGQDVNIVPYLKLIEKGDIDLVKKELNSLMGKYPDSQNLKFLEAVVTEDGDIAVDKYQQFYKNHPDNAYADAALYRIFSYYFALGVYQKADSYLAELKAKYPDSPYIKAANRKIPDKVEFVAAYPDNKIKEKPAVKTPPPPAKVTTPKPEVNKAPAVVYKYTVQAGAFSNKANAKELVSKIAIDGYFADYYEKVVGGTTFNIVIAGKFVSKEEAVNLIDHLETKYKLNGNVKEYNFGEH